MERDPDASKPRPHVRAAVATERWRDGREERRRGLARRWRQCPRRSRRRLRDVLFGAVGCRRDGEASGAERDSSRSGAARRGDKTRPDGSIRLRW